MIFFNSARSLGRFRVSPVQPTRHPHHESILVQTPHRKCKQILFAFNSICVLFRSCVRSRALFRDPLDYRYYNSVGAISSVSNAFIYGHDLDCRGIFPPALSLSSSRPVECFCFQYFCTRTPMRIWWIRSPTQSKNRWHFNFGRTHKLRNLLAKQFGLRTPAIHLMSYHRRRHRHHVGDCLWKILGEKLSACRVHRRAPSTLCHTGDWSIFDFRLASIKTNSSISIHLSQIRLLLHVASTSIRQTQIVRLDSFECDFLGKSFENRIIEMAPLVRNRF